MGSLIAKNIFTIFKLCFELKPVILIFAPIMIVSITFAIFTNLCKIAIKKNADVIEACKIDVSDLSSNTAEPNLQAEQVNDFDRT
jgi:hypothetical protein